MKFEHFVVGSLLGCGLLASFYAVAMAPPIEEQAEAYLMELYGPDDMPRYVCAAMDTDGDWYVSCTAHPDGEPVLQFACSVLGGGCKVPTMPAGYRGR